MQIDLSKKKLNSEILKHTIFRFFFNEDTMFILWYQKKKIEEKQKLNLFIL